MIAIDLVKKCMEYEVVGSRPRGRPKRTWLEVVKRDCQLCGLSNDDATVRGRWRKMIRMVDEQEGCVDGCFFWYRLTRVDPDKGP